MVIRYFKDYLDGLNEGLIKTNDAEIVVKNAEKTLQLLGLDIEGKSAQDHIEIEINNFNLIPIHKLEDMFDVIMVNVTNMGGWFPSYVSITSIYGKNKKSKYNLQDLLLNHTTYSKFIINFESKFGELESEIPEKLYHLSIKEYEQKILKYGLIPRSKNKLTTHIDRIFLCKTITDSEILIPQMIFYYKSEKDLNVFNNGRKKYKKDITPIIFEIDNSEKIIKTLYKDPNYKDRGFYTTDNIHAKYLKLKN